MSLPLRTAEEEPQVDTQYYGQNELLLAEDEKRETRKKTLKVEKGF